MDGAGNVLITDSPAHRVRRVDAAGTITTLAGSGTGSFGGDGGPATAATLYLPSSTLSAGGVTYIADYFNRRVRRVDAAGTIVTIAGIGPSGPVGPTPFGGGTVDRRQRPVGRAELARTGLFGKSLRRGHPNLRVRRITPARTIETIAGEGTLEYFGDGRLSTRVGLDPRHLAFDGAGLLHVADGSNRRVVRIDANGVASSVTTGFVDPRGLAQFYCREVRSCRRESLSREESRGALMIPVRGSSAGPAALLSRTSRFVTTDLQMCRTWCIDLRSLC